MAWYETFFDEHYLKEYAEQITPERNVPLSRIGEDAQSRRTRACAGVRGLRWKPIRMGFETDDYSGGEKGTMNPTESTEQPSVLPLKCAVSNTGPMISVFQSEQVDLLMSLYDRIYIPSSALPEYTKHGADALIEELIAIGYIVVCELSETEKQEAKQVSEEIANDPLTKDRVPQNHYAEAEAMALMRRPEFQGLEILLDEQAARKVARTLGLSVIGFAGVLIRACKEGQITSDAVREILFRCQSLGTHYATNFIEGIYKRLKEEESR